MWLLHRTRQLDDIKIRQWGNMVSPCFSQRNLEKRQSRFSSSAFSRRTCADCQHHRLRTMTKRWITSCRCRNVSLLIIISWHGFECMLAWQVRTRIHLCVFRGAAMVFGKQETDYNVSPPNSMSWLQSVIIIVICIFHCRSLNHVLAGIHSQCAIIFHIAVVRVCVCVCFQSGLLSSMNRTYNVDVFHLSGNPINRDRLGLVFIRVRHMVSQCMH